MTLYIKTYILGPLQNNTYLLIDDQTGQATIIDPSFDSESIIKELETNKWQLKQIWLTHAHFDHLAGIPRLGNIVGKDLMVYLHPGDSDLYQQKGGAELFGFTMGDLPKKIRWLKHNQSIDLGDEILQVRHTPGHTPGHVVFSHQGSGVVFCGDLIFQQGIGRTDLPGSSYPDLMTSINTQILTLPPKTRLLSGHGRETTVESEKQFNPFLAYLA
jgi:hydroxyacylglutathione hydrolase